MKLIDDALLEKFRRKTRCEWCRKPCPNGCDPAHILSRGAGRVDIPGNLVALCRACHCQNHAGMEPKTKQLLKLAGNREGRSPNQIKNEIHRIRRQSKP